MAVFRQGGAGSGCRLRPVGAFYNQREKSPDNVLHLQADLEPSSTEA
jgi:hypothetical protein